MTGMTERNAEICALRPELTYEEIGKRYGITRERVRQIVKANGGATGWYSRPWKNMEDRECPECGETFTKPKWSPVRYCCAHCGYHAREKTERAEQIIAMRRNGMKWREIGEELGFNATDPRNKGSCAQIAATAYAKRRGKTLKELL